MQRKGGVVALLVATISSFASLLFYINPLYFAPLIGLGFAAFVLLWGNFLLSFSHKTVLYMTMIPAAMLGIAIIIQVFLPSESVRYLAALFMIISCICIFLLQKKCLFSSIQTTKQEVVKSDLTSNRNSFSLVCIGMGLGSSSFATCLDINLDILLFVCGGCIFLACVALLVARISAVFLVEKVMQHLYTTIMTICLLVSICFSGIVNIIVFVLMFTVFVFYFVLLMDAIAETARIENLPASWKFGKEGFFCMTGLALTIGLLVLFQNDLLGDNYGYICATTVVICTIFQAIISFVDKNSFPFTNDEPQLVVVSEQKPKLFWRERIDILAKNYNLSPRQKEVMELLAKGRNTEYIARTFIVSPSTVKTHSLNLYHKLGIHSQQELIDLVESFTSSVVSGIDEKSHKSKNEH